MVPQWQGARYTQGRSVWGKVWYGMVWLSPEAPPLAASTRHSALYHQPTCSACRTGLQPAGRLQGGWTAGELQGLLQHQLHSHNQSKSRIKKSNLTLKRILWDTAELANLQFSGKDWFLPLCSLKVHMLQKSTPNPVQVHQGFTLSVWALSCSDSQL